jgi:hypothetical protein
VGRVEHEAGLLPHPRARALQDVGGQVEDGSARAALGVDVHVPAAHEVVRGRAVPDVHVLDDAEVAQGVEGAVDARAVDARVDVGHPGHDVLGPEVAPGRREHGEHRLARARHPFAARPQEPADLLDELRHGRLLPRFDAGVHAVIVPAGVRPGCRLARVRPVGTLLVVESAPPVTGRPPRAARLGAVALVAVATSVGGHALGGGPVPPLAALAAFTVAVAALTTPLARLRWTPTRLLGALAAAQGGFHLAFAHLGPAPGSAADLRMLAWHLAATAVACALVLRAEAWWWRVFAGLNRELLAPAPWAGAWTAPAASRVELPHVRARDRALPRRGPPLPAAA